MKSNFMLVGLIVVYIVIGGISSELGLTEPIFEPATEVPNAPADGGNWLDKIASALAPIAWAFNAIAGLFQLATYQATDVPPLVNTLIFLPMGTMLVYKGFQMVRG